MITIGLTALSLATIEHWRHRQTLKQHFDRVPYSLAAVISALVAGLGIAGLITVLLRQ
jgi:putative membrane protein